ncbi:hypothetical protein B0T17DRAFT_501435 [Bombardia bombarda]|uniref:Thymidylate kinase n=1 Tax=Bombardia bombarda TaxID=252184 RepID=A0AA39U258_9PEZI|nr:hypothetical protein B0T17DRAFT_501435 [Bombardia bombarda]
MAAVTRQPFAPLDGARLQNLTSLKNRQNGMFSASIKRKVSEVVDADDFENVDPSSLFAKRSKGASAGGGFSNDFFKPSTFTLTKAVPSPSFTKDILNTQPTKITSSSRPRTILQPKSPAARIVNSIPVSSSLTAPAGRSPTRGSDHIGILSRRRPQRVDPPAFVTKSVAPFSLDAALKGTIPNYSGSATTTTTTTTTSTSKSKSKSKSSVESLRQPEMKSSWFFDIHEDTPEQEMTNLLQHSTCTLDISSDEESEQRMRRDRDEGRDKENVPPADDVSQTSARAMRAADAGFDDMIIEKHRGPLAEMNVADYYAEGCDDSSVIIVHDDEDEIETVVDETEQRHQLELPPLPEVGQYEEEERLAQQPSSSSAQAGWYDYASPQPQISVADLEAVSVDAIMGLDEPSTKAAVLEPIEGTGDSFELWESGSAKDEMEVPAPASPAPVVEEISEANGVVPAAC